MDLQNIKEFHCDVCFELFDENRKCPRMLTCGHSFCHSCLENLLTQSPFCPNCKQGIHFPNIDRIPVNYSTKSIVSRFRPTSQVRVAEQNSELNPESVEEPSVSITLLKETSPKELLYEGYCEGHNSYKHLRCMDCKCWVCCVCAILSHKSCQTLLVAEAWEELKQEVSRDVEVEIEAQKCQNKYLDVILKDLKGKKSSLKHEIKELQLELRNKIKNLKSLDKTTEEIQSIKSDRKKHCEKLKRLETSAKEITNDDQLMKAKNKLNDLVSQFKIMAEELTISRHLHLTLENLRDRCRKGPVYASRCSGGVNQYGQVVVKGDRVWVYSFKPQSPKMKDVVINFRDLLITFRGSLELPKRGFIQVGEVEEGTSGLCDVVIATDALTPRAMNFLLLCSGIKGRSYEGISLPCCGRYIESPLNGGTVVKGIKDGGVYKTSRKKGFVYGLEVAFTEWLCGFGIWMEDTPLLNFTTKFGFVEEGLDFCEEIYNDITEAFAIKHCGLVI